jgi:hypothetical protein
MTDPDNPGDCHRCHKPLSHKDAATLHGICRTCWDALQAFLAEGANGGTQ